MQAFIIGLLLSFAAADDVIVDLKFGKILGRQDVTFENNTIYIFEKIPYAAPPIANLRFQPPQEHEGWDGILDTTHLDVTCFQTYAETNNATEDCLVLNIYTPKLPSDDHNELLPVMFYIHGGGFVGGSSDWCPGDRFVDKNVIFVSFNYRLGPLGFLSTGDAIIPGNYGLKDQQFALQWVFNNINLFSGDSSKITLVGQSAGSASVGYQLINQANAGLVAGAILESGSFLSPWAFERKASEIAFSTAAIMNATFETNRNSKDLLNFLLGVDAYTINEAATTYRNKINTENPEFLEITTGFDWTPVLEVKHPTAFLTKKMFKLLEAENILRVPIIIGLNSEEGLAFNTDPTVIEYNLEQYDAHLDWLVPEDMAILDLDQKKRMGAQIRDIYTNGEDLAGNLLAAVQVIYHGALSGQSTLFDGVAHGEEYRYFFCSGINCNITWAPEIDQQISDWFMTLWTNFAKYLDPIPVSTNSLQNITWPTVDVDADFLYLDIGENLEIKSQPKYATYSEWVKLYNSLNYNDFDTY